MRKTVVEHVYNHAIEDADKIAVITSDTQTTYGELWNLVTGYAAYLKSFDLQKGDVVLVRASQTIAYVVVYLACHLAGGVIASIEKSTPVDRELAMAKLTGASIIIDFNSDIRGIYNGKYIDGSRVIENAKQNQIKMDTFIFPDEDDLADILFTSGTTGIPKGAELTHKTLVATAENLIYGCKYTKDTFLVVLGPINHAAPIRRLFTTMVVGSTIYIVNGMANVKEFFTALNWPCRKISCFLPPAAIRVILQMTKDKIGEYADKIEHIEAGSSPLAESEKLKLCHLLPKSKLYNLYGSSEAALVCIYDYSAFPGLTGCVGKPMPNCRVMIVDDDKNEIKSSRDYTGLVACSGDVIMRGYVNDPEQTKEVLIDGIVYTNDMGYIDDNGFVFLSGRKDDMINVGGLKVAPVEIESAALEFEGIKDCICIAEAHPISGTVPKLLVVMQEQVDFNPKAIRTYLSEKLEAFKIPWTYKQVDKIERTYNGKLNRKFYQQSE